MDDTAALRRMTKRRDKADGEWRAEIRRLHGLGLSLRAIAKAAGVSHVAVLKMLRDYPEGITETFSPEGT